MVHSLFCASDLVNDDVIISYSDIIFDTKIISKLLKCNNSTIPLNYNWLNLWKMRMSKRDIINDAEDVKVKGKKIISIGSKINKDNIPNMQFMGLMKINEIDFFKMKKKYDELKKPNIDFTTFINLLIKSNVVDIEYIKSKLFWTEIDSYRDFVVAEKLIKNVDKI
jgi:choline kinase